jgi:hypothetical protein
VWVKSESVASFASFESFESFERVGKGFLRLMKNL